MERNQGHLTGELSEFQVALDLIENGCRVSYTHGQYPYDLIGDYDSELYRIQVKTAKQVRSQKFQITTRGYDPADVDLFAGYVSEKDEVFYIPYEESGKTSSVTYTPREILSDINAERANLAEDHTFKKAIARC